MKIMFVNHVASKKFGGAERVLDSLVLGVAKVAPRPVLLLQKGQHSDDDRWDCEPHVDLERFNFGELGGSSRLLSLGAMLLRITRALFYFPYLVRKYRLDAICANSLIAGAFCALPARLAGRRFIYYEHNIASQRKGLLIGMALAPVARLATDIVCISEAVRQGLVEEGVDPRKLHVIHNGYDFAGLDVPVRTQDLPQRHREGVLRIGMVANFIPWKRHDRFISIVDALSRHACDVKIEAAIVGGCLPAYEDYYRDVERAVADYDGPASISMLGFQENIADQFRSFDVLINPADAEPFGLIFVEAMYLGCVAVGSCDGSSSEIIDNGRTGLVLDYSDMNGVVEKLTALARERGLCQAMGKAASEDVRKRFSLDRQVSRFMELLA